MLFGNKQLNEKQEIIRCLEVQNAELKREAQKAEEKICTYERQIDDLKKNLSEVKVSLTEKQDECSSLIVQLKTAEKKIEMLHEKKEELESANSSLKSEKDCLRNQLAFYDKLTEEDYIKMGAKHFSVDKFIMLLDRAKSASFMQLQNDSKKMFLQRMVFLLEGILATINSDYRLLVLLGMVGEPENVNDIVNMLNKVKVKDILDVSTSLKIKKGNYQRIVPLPENAFVSLANSKTPEEYVRSLAITKLLIVIKQIADKNGEAV